jgi:hypothetical protein
MTVQRAAGFRNGIDVRVRLRSGAAAEVAFDGAWWPRSRDLGAELPELIAALDTSWSPSWSTATVGWTCWWCRRRLTR